LTAPIDVLSKEDADADEARGERGPEQRREWQRAPGDEPSPARRAPRRQRLLANAGHDALHRHGIDDDTALCLACYPINVRI
jgi:hypothetical protein